MARAGPLRLRPPVVIFHRTSLHMSPRLRRLLVVPAWCLALCCRLAADADELRLSEAVLTPVDRWEIPARSGGVLTTVDVVEGARVAAGQLLATIDDEEARLAVERAEIALEVARAEAQNELRAAAAAKTAEVAKAELQRAVESFEKYKKSVSETELDRLRLTVEQTTLEFKQAQHERALALLTVRLRENERTTARQAFDRRRVRAPADGVVVELLRRPGEWVEPATTIARITRTDRLRVEAFVDAPRARRLVDADVRFEPTPFDDAEAAREPPARGRLTFVSPEVNPVNGQVRLWAEIDNADGRLRQGLSGTLVIVEAAATASRGKSAKPKPADVRLTPKGP